MNRLLNKMKALLLLSLVYLVFGCQQSPTYIDREIIKEVDKPSSQKLDIIYIPNKYIWMDIKNPTSHNVDAEISNNTEVLSKKASYKRSSNGLSYESSDSNIVAVDAQGNLTAKSEGVAVIKITSVNNTADSEYLLVNTTPKKEVDNPSELVNVIALDFGTAADIYLDKKPNFYMYARALPLNAKNKKLKYVSLNKNVATVNEKGFIQGVAEGKTDIITYSDSNPEKFAVMTIKVYKTEPVIGNIYDIPEGLSKIEISDTDPMKALSLIGGYYVVNAYVEGEETTVPKKGSELRVNADLEDMGNGNVNILIYIKIDDKEVSLKIPRPLGDQLDIKGIFESLGAKITGDYNLQFRLDPKDYGRVADFGIVEKGKTLVLNLQKYRELEALATENPMGNDVVFDPNSKPSANNVPPINFPTDPFSLIAKYEVKNYVYNDGDTETPKTPSEFRVNANLDSNVGVNIEMYIKLNGRIYTFVKEKELVGADLNVMIENVFNSLGAKVTGSHTLDFTLDSSQYPELVKTGFMRAGEKLLLKLEKKGTLEPMGGLGDTEEDNYEPLPDTGEPEVEQPEIPELPDNTGKIEVEKIYLNQDKYTPNELNEQIQLKAFVFPEDAEDKTITWKSSNNNSATVTEAGLVTILKNDNVVITAESKNGKKAEFIIEKLTSPLDFTLVTDAVELILGINDEFNLSYNFTPSIIDNEGVEVVMTPNKEGILEIDNSRGFIKAIKPGETVVKVSIGSLSKDLFVKVLEKPDRIIPVDNISLSKEKELVNLSSGKYKINASVLPLGATNKKINYNHNCSNIQIDNLGNVKLNAVGSCEIELQAAGDNKIKKKFTLDVQQFASDIKFSKREYGIKVNEEMELAPIFEGNPSHKEYTVEIENKDVISVTDNKIRGLKTGSSNVTLTTPYGMKKFFTVHVYTPADMNNKDSLKGTYEIVAVEQWNGKLDVSTTSRFGHNIERMIGEITIDIQGNKVIMYNKIQMDSSAMNTFPGVAGFGVVEARQGQFNTFKFNEYDYNPSGFGSTGSKTQGRVTADSDGKLLISQLWKEGALGITVDVNVKTWIRKKSDTVKNINNRQLFWNYSNSDYSDKANAYEHFSDLTAASPEPYYKEGLSKQ